MEIILNTNLIPLAYLDPGTGAILIQIIVGGVAGFLVFVKYQGNRIRSFFRRGSAADNSDLNS